MNSCPHAKDLIAYQLGLLDNGQSKQFEAHLKQCSVCQQEMQIDAFIKEELVQKLEPGIIEQRVLANLRWRKSMETGFSWLYILRMGFYALAMITGALVLIHWLLEYPISKLFNLNINFNLFREFSVISSILDHPYLIGIFGLVLIGAGAVYSYRLLRE
jgi:hypothetical protein